MSTPNFYTQRNFKLYVQSFEPMTMEEYEAEEFSNDEYYYPEYLSAQSDSRKKYILEKSYNKTMTFWNEEFYSDIVNGYDGFKELMEEFNNCLMFHEVQFKSGYYDGIQLYVEEKENPHKLDNDDCRYYYDMCRSKAIRKYEAEIRKINRFMNKVATQYGWKELVCLGVFSNGEAIYQYATQV